jgi:hypothetical protein
VTGRHAGRVDDAEGAVWAEGIRACALVLANELEGWRHERPGCDCDTCKLDLRLLEFLTEIAGAP